MGRLFANRSGLWLVVAVVAMTNLVPAAGQAQITFLNTWGSSGAGNTQFMEPYGVAVGPTGTVYVADLGNARVQVFDSTGNYQSTIGTTSSPGPGNNQFDIPEGVAVGPTGTVFVADNGNDRVQVFNSAGVYQSTIGTTSSPGPGNNQFENPEGVAVGPTGSVYVADTLNQRVQVFNSSGVYQSTIGTTASAGPGNNQFNDPTGVAVGPTGTVYVADTLNQRVQAFNSSGVYQSMIGTTGSAGPGNNQFEYPNSVAVGPAGTVYVADTINQRVQVFSSAGVYQSTIGTTDSTGTGNNQFHSPEDVAVGPTGMIYVADNVNSRIVRLFDPASWVSGTNKFTDPTVGPTTVVVAPGQILGSTLTLNSAMGLVATQLNVDPGGSLTQAGGSVSDSNVYLGFSAPGGTYIYQGGSFNTSGDLRIGGGLFQANQGGALNCSGIILVYSESQVGGQLSLDGGTTLQTSVLEVQSGSTIYVGTALISASTKVDTVFGGELQLGNANSSILQTPLVQDHGLLDGSGRVLSPITIFSGGEVNVGSGQSMAITGVGNTNAGLISLTGGALHFSQDLTNQSGGQISGVGTLRVDGGLINLGGASITLGGLGPAYVFGTVNNSATLSLAGSAGVFGTVTNNGGATIHLSGNTPNIFYSAVSNGGAINIDAGAIGLFYGGVTGSGTITNSGSAQFDATSIAGAVSGMGVTSIVSAVTLNASSFTQGGLTLQLAGDTAGSYSKLDVAGALNLAGKLTVSVAGGFTPALGNSFDLLDWGSLSGHFSSLSLPALSSGLAWDTNALYTTGTLSVIDTHHLPGDINRDGQGTVADIKALMVALSNLNAYQAANPDLASNPQLLTQVLDVNGDGKIDNTDLQALITLVVNNTVSGGGALTAVPEPSTLILSVIGLSVLAMRRLRRPAAR